MTALAVRDVGDGPPVVLLHAFPCDGRMWWPQADALVAGGYRVIVPDLPGFGGSALAEDRPTLSSVADEVLGMLDDRGIERCALAGVSLGGYVTMEVLRRRSGLASAVILCDTKATADSPLARENRESLAVRCLDDPTRTGEILEQVVLPGLLGATSRASRPDVADTVRGWLGDAGAESVAWYQRAMAARDDSLALLGTVRVPVLVLYGDEDTLSPAIEQELMLSSLADARTAVVEGAGHLANVERPERVAAEMLRFLG